MLGENGRCWSTDLLSSRVAQLDFFHKIISFEIACACLQRRFFNCAKKEETRYRWALPLYALDFRPSFQFVNGRVTIIRDHPDVCLCTSPIYPPHDRKMYFQNLLGFIVFSLTLYVTYS